MSPTAATASRAPRRKTSLFAHGEATIWLTGGALVLALAMIGGLLLLVLAQGLSTFWPTAVQEVVTHDGRTLLADVADDETYAPSEANLVELPESVRPQARRLLEESEGSVRRRMLRTGNFDLTGSHFTWVSDLEVARESLPPWATVVERLTWGRFYGTPVAFLLGDDVVAEGPEASWARFEEHHADVRARWHARRDLETRSIGDVNRRQNQAALAVRKAEIEAGLESAPYRRALEARLATDAWAQAETERIQGEIQSLRQANAPYRLRLVTSTGATADLPLEDIVRATTPNRLSWAEKVGVYVSRWWEFLSDPPREANSEGGVWPALFGTVVMTLLMSIVVAPLGVLAALYLREYARAGWAVSTVRIAINNLAGVPSIVYGVFGLGFFCYVVGVQVDTLFFPEHAPNPVYGKGGILWASLTLALLTLPVVIVATEEALAAVPGSMREGSYACGASKWQTIRRIVLPRSLPGIMTGMILAVARGAGEVAPLMLVGAVKLAPDLPLDATPPFVHPERSFMHLGFHIYDLGFQSQNSEAAKPMVFSTTLLLITIVVVLNALSMSIRARLRRRFGIGA